MHLDGEESEATLMDSGGGSSVRQRLLAHTNSPQNITDPLSIRDVFNDLQILLSSEHTAWKFWQGCHYPADIHYSPWNPEIENDITRVRNLMNASQSSVIEICPARGLDTSQQANKQLTRPLDWSRGIGPRHRKLKQSSWMTSHGIMHATFLTRSTNRGMHDADIDSASSMEGPFSGRIALVPERTGTPLSCIIFNFASITGSTNLSMNLTYYPMIPNSSRIFEIVNAGDLQGLIEALENGDASLNDRDEQGRSLLNVSLMTSLGSKNTTQLRKVRSTIFTSRYM